jgi:threonine synthase
MLSPHGRMSAFQRAQMYTLLDSNIHNLAVKGTFDACQDLVKQVNADRAFKARHRLGAVNSINWARVAAQIVYYFKGYFAATRSNAEQVSFAVPTGNFGNIYAGHVARSMGLPVKQLILATNENDVLDEFFRSGRYRTRRTAQETSSPSMDITKASNFERYVFELEGRDGVRVAALWRSWAGRNSAAPRLVDRLGARAPADRIATIRRLHQRCGITVDRTPPTASRWGSSAASRARRLFASRLRCR